MSARQEFGRCAIVCWSIGAILGVLALITAMLLGKMGFIWALLIGLLVTAILGWLLTMMLCTGKDAPATYAATGAVAGGAVAAGAAGAGTAAHTDVDHGAMDHTSTDHSATAHDHTPAGLVSTTDTSNDDPHAGSETRAYETGTVGLTRADDDMDGDMRVPASASGAAGGDVRAFGAAPQSGAGAAANDERASADEPASGEATTQPAAASDAVAATQDGAQGGNGDAGTANATTANATAVGGSAAPAAGAGSDDTDAAAQGPGTRPESLAAPRDGGADNLKEIKGVGPKLEQLLHTLGFFHFDQIAAWTADEVSWVDQNLKGFKGRVSRDHWVDQAKVLAVGGETEFSKKVSKGGVY